MPPLSDFRSDSPLNFICVACSYLGSSEYLDRARMLMVVGIVRFCYHRDVFSFHDPRSIHKPSSHTRSCFQPDSSRWLSTPSKLRRTGVTAIKLSLELPQRYFLPAPSFTTGVDLITVAQFFASVASNPRRIVRENIGIRVCVLSGTKSVDRGFSCAAQLLRKSAGHSRCSACTKSQPNNRQKGVSSCIAVEEQ